MNHLTRTVGRYLWLSLFLLIPLIVEAQDATPPEQIIFSSSRGRVQKLYVINADGTGERPLDDRIDQEFAPKVSPDGRMIAYLSQDENGAENVYVMGSDGSDPRLLTNIDICMFTFPGYAWSPDSTELAVSWCDRENNSHLVIMTLDGAVERELPVRGMGLIYGVGGWTPDGAELLINGNAPKTNSGYQTDTIFTFNLKTSKLHTLTKTIDAVDGRLSPDGTRIVYVVRDDENQTTLNIMNIDGSNPQRVNLDYAAFKGVGRPVWSPDGARLAFTGLKVNGLLPIMVMNADGTALTQVTDEGRNDTAEWLPAGLSPASTATAAA